MAIGQVYNPYYYNTKAYTPKTSVDSVKIDIVNPKASLSPANLTPPQNTYNPPYYYPYPNNIPPYQNRPQYPQQQQPQNPQQPQKPQAPEPPKPPEQKPIEQTTPEQDKPKPEPKKIGNIPVDVIKALDEGLSSPNQPVRFDTANKLMQTFKENPDSADNPALTILLNRVIQDPNSNVRLLGLTTLNAGYANGNDDTKQLLENIKIKESAFDQDEAILARTILFKKVSKPQTGLIEPKQPNINPPVIDQDVAKTQQKQDTIALPTNQDVQNSQTSPENMVLPNNNAIPNIQAPPINAVPPTYPAIQNAQIPPIYPNNNLIK